jgi:hypothetical protein
MDGFIRPNKFPGNPPFFIILNNSSPPQTKNPGFHQGSFSSPHLIGTLAH